MSTLVPSIGFFQLDNLLKTKVPFLLVNLEADLSPYFKGPDWEHIQTYQLSVPAGISISDLNQQLELKNIPKHYPIVCVCNDGQCSMRIAEQLDQQSWLNCFYVFQGAVGLAQS